MGDWEQNNLIKELEQGRELAKQLQIHLSAPTSCHETRELLVQKILASYGKALSMLNCSSGDQPHLAGVGIGTSESPPSLCGSPRSEDSDRDLKDLELRDLSRKRKSLPRWTQQVRVNPGAGLEGPLDDGYGWRKYGQKDILGAKYPRGYYRCTHRNVQGCLATKQVQRSDDDPTIFEITYRGKHTCNQASHTIPPPVQPEINQEPNTTIESQTQIPSQELLMNFQTGLRVVTQDLDTTHQNQPLPPSFNLLSSSNQIMMENQFMGHFSPPYISQAPSNNNYFSVSPDEFNQNFQKSEPELTHVIPVNHNSSVTNTNSSLDFPFGSEEFDPNFTFPNSGFFG